ncbi:MAG: septal ring lytic transglycosylase RlpA family protein [Pelovirga sp.]
MNLFHRLAVVVLLLALLLLSACARPVYQVRVIDTPESRELPGWQKPYEVNGVRFYPLAEYQGFRERGTASWYGRDFHGLKTSNGEIYDMYGVSAAHKTLPMGTTVRVTHLASGRQVTVRINDRGPFVGDRIIDLSYGAARELGIVESGLGEVEIVALSGTYNPVIRTAGVAIASYAVQIAAFSSADNATDLATAMRSRFGKAQVAIATVNGQSVHRVRVGDFATLEEAEQAVNRFVAEGYANSFVVAFN